MVQPLKTQKDLQSIEKLIPNFTALSYPFHWLLSSAAALLSTSTHYGNLLQEVLLNHTVTTHRKERHEQDCKVQDETSTLTLIRFLAPTPTLTITQQ